MRTNNARRRERAASTDREGLVCFAASRDPSPTRMEVRNGLGLIFFVCARRAILSIQTSHSSSKLDSGESHDILHFRWRNTVFYPSPPVTSRLQCRWSLLRLL